MSKFIIITVIATIAVIGGYLASPLFYETEVNEPLPTALNQIEPGLTFENFVNMEDEKRMVLVEKMPDQVKDLVMEKAEGFQTTVSEDINDMMKNSQKDLPTGPEILKIGEFEGLAGHSAKGTAKILKIGDSTLLRFEPFEVTNGPDLRVYLTQDGDVKKGIQLDKLKGSMGHQHYFLENIDYDVYDTVVIYCQPFGVYFAQASLS